MSEWVKVELSAKKMQTIMLCLRGEYEKAEDADTLHDDLANEGFTAFEATQAAVLMYKDD